MGQGYALVSVIRRAGERIELSRRHPSTAPTHLNHPPRRSAVRLFPFDIKNAVFDDSADFH